MITCTLCKDITFDLFLRETSIKHHTVETLSSTSNHCPLCRLILKAIKRLIAENVGESASETAKWMDSIRDRSVKLSFPTIEEAGKGISRDRLHISLEGSDLMIDGWLVFSSRDAGLSIVHGIGESSVVQVYGE